MDSASTENRHNIKPNIRFYMSLVVMFSGIAIFLISVNYLTVDQSMVSAPCDLILSNAPIPDSVVTKGYDIIRDDDGEMIGQDCYYIKDASLIERIIYQWDLYKI